VRLLWITVSLSLLAAAVGQAQEPDDGNLPELFIYVNDTPPYLYRGQDGTIEGEWLAKIDAFMNPTGLEYTIAVVPWSRAYIAGTTRNNALIAHLDRTEGREGQFYWLLPLLDKTNHLVGRRDSEYVDSSIAEILAGDGVAACVTNSIQCEMLRQLGFPQDRIWILADFAGEPISTLVSRGRVDFWLESYEMFSKRLEFHDGDVGDFALLFEVNTVTAYLAASHSIHPEILKRLLAAAEGY
jgi:polar amino acid transport system substrate-binding protein